MHTQNTHGWSTLQEGNEHYLYRPISSLSFNNIEAIVQQLQDCQNPSIAIPEIVRTPNGDIYLKEPRGLRSIEDFLQTNPSTRAKLFVVQQLVKLLENLHTFVGMSHGNLHLSCLSIDADNKLILGGISPSNRETSSTDIEDFKSLLPQIFATSEEELILDQLQGKSFKQIRGAVKALLAEDTWDDIQSDWSTAVHNTNIEESSEDVLSSPTPSTLQTNTNPYTPETSRSTFDGLDDDLNSLPEPELLQENVHTKPITLTKQKEQSEDDWESTLEDSEWDDDWDDLNLDTWLEDDVSKDTSLSEFSLAPIPDAQPNNLSVEMNTALPLEHDVAQTTTNILSKLNEKTDNSENLHSDFDDWFTDSSLPSPYPPSTTETEALSNLDWEHTEWEATKQTHTDLEELSDFDEEDDFAFEVTEAISSNHATHQSKAKSESVEVLPAEIDQNDTLDFLLDSPNTLTDLSDIDDFNETDDSNQFDQNIPALDDEGDFATDIFSRSSLLGTLDIPAADLQDTFDDDPSLKNPVHEIEEDKWFAPESTSKQSFDTTQATTQESNGLPKWAWVAGLVVVAGGAWASTRNSNIKDPNVLIDESQTKTTSTKELAPAPSVEVVEATKTDEQPNLDENVQVDDTPQVEAVVTAEVVTESVSTETKVKKTNIGATATTKSTPTKIGTQKTNTTKKASPFTQKSPAVLTSSQKTTATKPITSVDSLPPPKKNVAKKNVVTKSVETPKQPATTIVTKTTTPPEPVPEKVTTTKTTEPTPGNKQLTTPTEKETTKTTKTPDPTPMEVAKTLQAMVAGETITPKASTEPTIPSQESSSQTEKRTTTEQTNPIPHSAVDAVAVQVQKTEQTPSPIPPESTSTVPPQDRAQDKKASSNKKQEPPSPTELSQPTDNQLPRKSVTTSLSTEELNGWSKQAITGRLDTKKVADLQLVSKEEPTFTRAQSIVLTHAQQSGNTELIGQSLEQILSIDANTHKPIYLLAMAQHQFNQQNLDGARDYLMQAERNWVNVEREQLMVLRAQRDNIVAHLSYVSFLETGSEDSRLQSVSHFRKVKREAGRAKLRSLLEQAESKIQHLKGGNE